MKAMAIAFTVLAATCLAAATQTSSGDEAAIRELIAKRNVGQMAPGALTPDAVFWSGALVKPVEGAAKPQYRPGSSAGARLNTATRDEVVQLHVSTSGDMAYEYSTFHTSWIRKDDRRKVEFDGAVLRTWRKIDGRWKVAAEFRQSYDATQTEQ